MALYCIMAWIFPIYSDIFNNMSIVAKPFESAINGGSVSSDPEVRRVSTTPVDWILEVSGTQNGFPL